MPTKRCSKCGTTKEHDCFYKRSDKPHLIQSHCIACLLIKRKEFDNTHSDKRKARDRKYRLANLEKRKQYLKTYHQENKEKTRLFFNTKYHSDLNFKLSQNIRNRIRMAIKRGSKASTTEILLGASIKDVSRYIESKFVNGMSWDLFMKGAIHIDHKKPCALFDLSDPEQQKECFHYTNLQPLFAIDNLLKGAKYEKEVPHR
jgi:hypothetical protein